MTEFSFYHLLTTSLEQALPKLLERVAGLGLRSVVVLGSPDRIASVSTALWTADPASFLAHGSARDSPERAARQPIWLTDRLENPNGAQVLILADGATAPIPALGAGAGDDAYVRRLDIFDGNDEAAVIAARERYKTAKDAGFPLKYFRQTAAGWETR
jgi:DNA polymerase III subunit chi